MKKSYGISFASLNLPVENHRRVQITPEQFVQVDLATVPQGAILAFGRIPPFGEIIIRIERTICKVVFYNLVIGEHDSLIEMVHNELFAEAIAPYMKGSYHPRGDKKLGMFEFSVPRVRSGAVMLKKINVFLDQLRLKRNLALACLRAEVLSMK